MHTDTQSPHTVTEQSIPPLSKLNILLIDDSQTYRDMIGHQLNQFGAGNVYQARNGQEALEFIYSSYEKINMIICDWVMPEMDGEQLLERIRALDADIPFIMVTSQNDLTHVRKAKSKGVTDYLTKPVDFTRMQQKLFTIHNRIFETVN